GRPPQGCRAGAGCLHHRRCSALRLRKDNHLTEISFTYLSGPDIAALEMTDDEILNAVERGLTAQGLGQSVIEPRVHLEPDPSFNGHFNVLRGYIGKAAGFSLGGLAGVKIVGDYVDNYKKGLPSEMALLNLFDPE